MSKKIGGNEQCPCGSGEKYKRCCRMQKRHWYRDSKGRVYPRHIHDSVCAATCESLLEHLEMADKLGSLRHWMHFGHAMALLPRPMQVSVMADMGAPGSVLLFAERSGYVPDIEVFMEWEATGVWMVHPDSSDYYRRTVEQTLHAVVEAYPHLQHDPVVKFLETHYLVLEHRLVGLIAYDRPPLDVVTEMSLQQLEEEEAARHGGC